MEIPDAWASLLISSVSDAILFHEQLLTSETLKDRSDYEEHLLQLGIFLGFLKEEYRTTIEAKGGMPLARFMPDPPPVSNVVPLAAKTPAADQ